MIVNKLAKGIAVAQQTDADTRVYIPDQSVNLNKMTNTAKLQLQGFDAVVGSSDQVASGLATHLSLQAAHDAVLAGQTIRILSGSYTGATTITKQVSILGLGRASQLNGTVTLSSTASFCYIVGVRFVQNVAIQAGATGNILQGFFKASAAVITDAGTDTLLDGVGE